MISISNWMIFIITLILTFVNKRFFPVPMELVPDDSSSVSTGSSSGTTDDLAIDLNIFGRVEVDSLPMYIEVDPNDTWPPFSVQIFQDWGSFLKIGVPASLSQFMEWGSWEVNAFFVARFGSNTLAAHAIAANLAGLWYMPAIGLSSAVTTMIGNSLGAGDAENARSIARIGMVISFLFSVLNGGFGILYRNVVGSIFSDDAEVCAFVAGLMFILYPYHVADIQKCICMAILRGCGKPHVTMVGNMIATLMVGYPLAYVFGWVLDMKMIGVWISMTIAWTVSSMIFLVYVFRLDWEKEALQALESIKDSKLQQHKILVLKGEAERFRGSSEFETPTPPNWEQYLLEKC